MRIGIDARFLMEQGLGRYTRNLINNLQKIDKTNEYYIFLLTKDFAELNLQDNFHKVAADIRWYTLTEQYKYPLLLNNYKLDLMHFIHFNVPLLYFGKFVVTIHDLIHLDFKNLKSSRHNKLIYELKHLLMKIVLNQAIKRSEQILTVSEYVKNELAKRWDLDNKKIVVTYEGVDLDINTIADTGFLNNLGIKDNYLLYVGNSHPHKNVEGLIMAFLGLKDTNPSLQLVLVTNKSIFWSKIKSKYQHPDIIYTGFVNDGQLATLYKKSRAYVFPSFSEGFGLPLLEAMSMGTVVVSSNKTSLPEIASDAALYFDPHNIQDIKEKILEALNNNNLRMKLIAKGYKRVKLFNWEDMAKNTLTTYQKIKL